MKPKLDLLPKNLLIKTNLIDHADWNYRHILGYIQRKRFRLSLWLMGGNKYNRILEIGYGSGIFLPTLAQHCNSLYGIDIHPFNEDVREILQNFGVNSKLYQGSVSQLPFENDSFDLIISISTFEFIEDKTRACQEINRVLRKDGIFIMVTPGKSWFLDIALKIFTNASAKKDYGDKRQHVIENIQKYFYISKRKLFPSHLNWLVEVYKAYVLIPK
jgi:ubiquinone/menaquinone biosynthesis C-methylase UbiE